MSVNVTEYESTLGHDGLRIRILCVIKLNLAYAMLVYFGPVWHLLSTISACSLYCN